jgi:hypothetical protein
LIDVNPASANWAKVARMRASFRRPWLAAAMGLLMGPYFVDTTAGAETVFTEHCGKCHPRAASVARSVKGNSEQDRREALDRFLSSHHAEGPTLRAEIVDYLIGLLPQ